LHYQKDPFALGKLVRCAAGEIFDVAVDLRAGSPSFGKWVGVNLSSRANGMIYVPPGFAHGFCVLSETADVMYKMTGYLSRDHDRAVRWDDPDIGVAWPVLEPVLSARDREASRLNDADVNFRYRDRGTTGGLLL
jgi:dTDP-4-dehydrorhamnose 3,5-epimerase